MPIENNINGNITVPFNLQQTPASSLTRTSFSHADSPDAQMYHILQRNDNISEDNPDKPYQFYLSQIEILLHEISRQGNAAGNVDKIINQFIEELSCTDCIPEPLKLNLYHDSWRYLHSIMLLVAKKNTPEIQDDLRRMYIYIEKGLGIALNIIPAFFEKINSIVTNEIYEKIWIIKKQLIEKKVFEYAIKMHGLSRNDEYINAYKYQLRDTPWGIDYVIGDKTIDFEKIAETDDTLCDLMQNLTRDISLGKIISSLGNEVYNGVLTILKKRHCKAKEKVLSSEKTSNINNYLRKNYPFLCFTDCVKFDKGINEFVLEYPEMIYSAIATALAKHDISQRYFQIQLAMETIKIRIRYIEGFYWIENKSNCIQFPLTLNILKREKISGVLDEDLLKFSIINSDINQITNNLNVEWLDNPENVFYEIEHPAIFIAATHFFTENRLPINNTYKNGTTLLMAAIIFRNRVLIDYILTRSDLDINVKDNSGLTALALAVKLDSREILLDLLSYKKIDVNPQDNKGKTPLMMAIQTGIFAISNKLLKHGDININIQDCKGNTALIYAIFSGKKIIIRQLIDDKRTDINIINNDGHSALFLSLTKDFSITKKIINHKSININGDNPRTTPLIKAVTENRLSIVKLLLPFPNLDINRCNTAGSTALHIAVAMGSEDIVEALLENRHINMDIKDGDNLTPLELAIKHGNENIKKNIAYYKTNP
jgi:ankyrin repeat protein